MVLFGDLSSNESYWYHYTRSERLAQILDGGRLRFGPYSGTNDPREKKEWWAGMMIDSDSDESPSPEEFYEYNNSLGELLKQRSLLLCLSEDQPVDARKRESWPFRRGWGRARMWEQYADSHTGACLIFDQAALRLSFKELAKDARFAEDGQIRYDDAPINILLSYTEYRNLGMQAIVDHLVISLTKPLFFTKNTDWATESEYRFILVMDDGEPRFMPIDNCLSGIVVGEAFPSTEASVLRDRLRRINLPDLPVGRCFWHNGAPQVLPFDPEKEQDSGQQNQVADASDPALNNSSG